MTNIRLMAKERIEDIFECKVDADALEQEVLVAIPWGDGAWYGVMEKRRHLQPSHVSAVLLLMRHDLDKRSVRDAFIDAMSSDGGRVYLTKLGFKLARGLEYNGQYSRQAADLAGKEFDSMEDA